MCSVSSLQIFFENFLLRYAITELEPETMVFKLKLSVVVVVDNDDDDDDDDATAAVASPAAAVPALLLLLCCCVPQIPSAFNTVSQARSSSYENANRTVFGVSFISWTFTAMKYTGCMSLEIKPFAVRIGLYSVEDG